MRLDGAKKWYLAAALASVLVLVGGWFLLVSPQRQQADDVAAQADQQRAANALMQTKIDSLKAEYTNLPSLQQQLALVQSHMPQTPSEPALLRSLSQAAASAGVQLTSVSPATPTSLAAPSGTQQAQAATSSTGGQVQVMNVAIEVKGLFANTRLFMSNLEALPRSVIVTNLQIARDQQAGTQGIPPGTLDTTISARVFTLNPASATAAAVTTTNANAAAPAANG